MAAWVQGAPPGRPRQLWLERRAQAFQPVDALQPHPMPSGMIKTRDTCPAPEEGPAALCTQTSGTPTELTPGGRGRLGGSYRRSGPGAPGMPGGSCRTTRGKGETGKRGPPIALWDQRARPIHTARLGHQVISSAAKGGEGEPVNQDKMLEPSSWEQMARCFYICKGESAQPKAAFISRSFGMDDGRGTPRALVRRAARVLSRPPNSGLVSMASSLTSSVGSLHTWPLPMRAWACPAQAGAQGL